MKASIPSVLPSASGHLALSSAAFQQNVVPVTATPQLIQVLKEGSTANGSSVLLLPDQFMGLAEDEHIAGTVDLGLVGSWYDRPLVSTAVTEAQSLGVPCLTVWWVSPLSWYGVSASSASLTQVDGNSVFALYEVKM